MRGRQRKEIFAEPRHLHLRQEQKQLRRLKMRLQGVQIPVYLRLDAFYGKKHELGGGGKSVHNDVPYCNVNGKISFQKTRDGFYQI